MRPYVIVGAFVIGMFLTPPDVFSQTFLAVPMWLLFEAGVFLSRFFVKRAEEATEPAADGPAAGVAAVPAARTPADYRRMTPDEMEAELDRIEAEELAARERERAAARAAEAPETDHDAEPEPEAGVASGPAADPEVAAQDADPDDPFGRRAAAQAKLERVMALRASGDVVKARQLLYEVLVEGGEDQVFVARNILSQLDQPG
jgi:sec-independent protein translocase protein TatC